MRIPIFVMALFGFGFPVACQAHKSDRAKSPFQGTITLSEVKGFVISDPVVALATVETDTEGNRVFTATFADRNSSSSPLNQFQIKVFGDVKAGEQNSPAADCKSRKGLVGTCAKILENGTSSQLFGGFIKVEKLPFVNGQQFAMTFELGNGPEKQLKGSASGITEAQTTVPLEPSN